jgi:sterol 3beta-glucosyltransferase
MRITILTIGSRGDAEPCLALALGLKQAGHEVTLATGPNFETLVRGRGLGFAPLHWDSYEVFRTDEGRRDLSGNRLSSLWQTPPAELARWRRVMDDAVAAARGADALVYHPYVQGAYDAAEKLRIPAILFAFAPQFTPTAQFPSPYVPFPYLRLGGVVNRLTHSALRFCLFKKFTAVRNRWRVEALGLPPRPWYASDFYRDGRPLPLLYPFSRRVIPPPRDWHGPVEVTGYWWYDNSPGWRPPGDLAAFLEAGPPPVYVGFGSMVSVDPARVTETVLAALRQSGRRGILSAGWGGLARADGGPGVFYLDEASHTWLFPRVAAVVHHGGAGTTAAGLRAGRPTIVCPYSFDQPFWGKVVWQLGAGPRPVPQARLSADRLAAAIRVATTDEGMRQRAKEVGEKIRSEDGVARAVELIERYLSKPAGPGHARQARNGATPLRDRTWAGASGC